MGSSPSSLPSGVKAAGHLSCWEDPGGFSVDGDVLEPRPLRIVQLDGLEVQRPTHQVNFGGKFMVGMVKDALSNDAFGKLLSFSRFMGLPLEGFKNEILTLLPGLECRKGAKILLLEEKRVFFLRSRFERVKARVIH